MRFLGLPRTFETMGQVSVRPKLVKKTTRRCLPFHVKSFSLRQELGPAPLVYL